MAKVKVVLKEPVDKLGNAGDVALVAGGYARNYLIPRGLAVPATAGNLKHAESWRRAQDDRVSKELEAAQALRSRVEGPPLRITAQAGPDGRLFGSVTPVQIASAIQSERGVRIDRHAVEVEEPIRHLGLHEVKVRLHPQVRASVTVEAVDPSGVTAPAAATEEAPPADVGAQE